MATNPPCDPDEYESEESGCIPVSACSGQVVFAATLTSDRKCFAGWFWQSLEPSRTLGHATALFGRDLSVGVLSQEHLQVHALSAADGTHLGQLEQVLVSALPEDAIVGDFLLSEETALYSLTSNLQAGAPFPTGEGQAHLLDLASGALAWSAGGDLSTAPSLAWSSEEGEFFAMLSIVQSGTGLLKIGSEGEPLWAFEEEAQVFDWVTTANDEGDLHAAGIVVDSLNGNALVVGGFSGESGANLWSVDLPVVSDLLDIALGPDGATYVVGVDEEELRIAKVLAAGEISWQERLAVITEGLPVRLAIWSDVFVLTGTTRASLDERGNAGEGDVWFTLVDAETGSQRGTFQFGTAQWDQVDALTATPDGVILTGTTHGSLDGTDVSAPSVFSFFVDLTVLD